MADIIARGMAANAQGSGDLSGYIKKSEVVNTLTSDSTTAPLSANMGKELNEKKVQIEYTRREWDSIKDIFPKRNAVVFYSTVKNVILNATKSDGCVIRCGWDNGNFGRDLFIGGQHSNKPYFAIRTAYNITQTDYTWSDWYIMPSTSEVNTLISPIQSLIDTNNISNIRYKKEVINFDDLNAYMPTADDEGLTIYSNVNVNKFSSAETAVGFLHVFVKDNGSIGGRLILISTSFNVSPANHNQPRLLIKTLYGTPLKWGLWYGMEMQLMDVLNNATQTEGTNNDDI